MLGPAIGRIMECRRQRSTSLEIPRVKNKTAVKRCLRNLLFIETASMGLRINKTELTPNTQTRHDITNGTVRTIVVANDVFVLVFVNYLIITRSEFRINVLRILVRYIYVYMY